MGPALTKARPELANPAPKRGGSGVCRLRQVKAGLTAGLPLRAPPALPLPGVFTERLRLPAAECAPIPHPKVLSRFSPSRLRRRPWRARGTEGALRAH